MITYKDNCQDLLTLIRSDLLGFYTDLDTAKNKSSPTVRLKLNNTQLAALLGLWDKNSFSVICSFAGNFKETKKLFVGIQSWSELSDANQTWHLIADTLTDQELTGEISSELVETMHYFIQRTPGHHFLVQGDMNEINVPDRQTYQEAQMKIHVGATIKQRDFIQYLVNSGYNRASSILEPNSFRVLGEIIDINHVSQIGTYSITLYRSVIESIVQHIDRRSTNRLRLNILPVSFPAKVKSLTSNIEDMFVVHPNHFAAPSAQPSVIYDALVPDFEFPLREMSQPTTSAQIQTGIFFQNRDRITDYVDEHHFSSILLCSSSLALQPLALATKNLQLMSEAFLFPEFKMPPSISYDQGLDMIANLTSGKPAVHSDHGIGIFEGLKPKLINGQVREYLWLRYAQGDNLLVPVEYAFKVTAFLGPINPVINRLNGAGWKKIRQRAEHDAQVFATELIELAGQRREAHRPPYIVDSTIETSLNNSFPYQLTPDQISAWHAVKKDLSSTTPIDRLIVGDVGFGKTEIAIRAARHVVANGKQVAILAPTTLLVQQHSDLFLDRLPEISDKIVSLSRFATPTQKRRVREKIASTPALIAIGTHALLSKKTSWYNLGLVIIDEEQRFGVSQKEHFKKIRTNVDVLSLSATPIPRTLSMALASLKQLSVISSAPAGRKSVKTIIVRDSDAILKEAIATEHARGGQVYVVAPKIRGLNTLVHRIRKLLPQVTVAVAHGRLPAATLAATMKTFDRGETAVLVSSTIIANGLDLPRANTIIVTRSTDFGLADLYQLRGRIGRRDVQGYAYFLFTHHHLTGIQRQRLSALTEAARLGSGWSVARRDLEIRGAGNLLGAEQSGSINNVGVQLYIDMVRDTVDRKNDFTIQRHDVEIQLPLVATIPPHYIADEQLRTSTYQNLARAGSREDLNLHIDRLTKKFGWPPIEASTLYSLLHLQHAAAKSNIKKIMSQRIEPSDEDPYERLIVQAVKVSGLVYKLRKLGNWEVRNNKLTLDVDAVTPKLVDQLLSVLQ